MWRRIRKSGGKNLGYGKRKLDKQFKNPIAEVDIRTGEGYCRILEHWDNERLETIEE